MNRIALFLLLQFGLGSALANSDQIVILGLFPGKAVMTIDGVRRVLAVGETSPEGVRLIEADSEAAELEVAGRRAYYTLGNQIGGSYAPPVQQMVALFPDMAGMYTTEGSINGQSVAFLVDTGASAVAMNAAEARRLGIDVRRGTPVNIETASGVSKAYRVILERVKVGDIQLYQVDAFVMGGNYPGKTLLGMSFLGRVEMQREGSKLVLKKNP